MTEPKFTVGRRLTLLGALAIGAGTLVALAVIQPDLASQLIDAVAGLFGGGATPAP